DGLLHRRESLFPRGHRLAVDHAKALGQSGLQSVQSTRGLRALARSTSNFPAHILPPGCDLIWGGVWGQFGTRVKAKLAPKIFFFGGRGLPDFQYTIERLRGSFSTGGIPHLFCNRCYARDAV